MKRVLKLLPLVNEAMCAILLLLLTLDVLWPRWGLFLSEIVKLFLLLTCLVSAINGARLFARLRRRRIPQRRGMGR